MTQNDKCELERFRGEKINSLGYLCYNLYVDGVMVFPEMKELVDSIKKTISTLLILRKSNFNTEYVNAQEAILNDKLIELGCVCYNLYVDSKLYNFQLLSLCNTISSINTEISNNAKSGYSADAFDLQYPKSKRLRSVEKNVTSHRLKIIYPYGMESIPANYKKCICGYRNRTEAKFCGKCGAKIS